MDNSFENLLNMTNREITKLNSLETKKTDDWSWWAFPNSIMKSNTGVKYKLDNNNFKQIFEFKDEYVIKYTKKFMIICNIVINNIINRNKTVNEIMNNPADVSKLNCGALIYYYCFSITLNPLYEYFKYVFNTLHKENGFNKPNNKDYKNAINYQLTLLKSTPIDYDILKPEYNQNIKDIIKSNKTYLDENIFTNYDVMLDKINGNFINESFVIIDNENNDIDIKYKKIIFKINNKYLRILIDNVKSDFIDISIKFLQLKRCNNKQGLKLNEKIINGNVKYYTTTKEECTYYLI